jgi:hypothetical protein
VRTLNAHREGPDTSDAIRQRDTIFRFSLTDNFDPNLNFPNIYSRSAITRLRAIPLFSFVLLFPGLRLNARETGKKGLFGLHIIKNLLSLPDIGCFINFQKLKNRIALSNHVRCVWTLIRVCSCTCSETFHENENMKLKHCFTFITVLLSWVFPLWMRCSAWKIFWSCKRKPYNI